MFTILRVGVTGITGGIGNALEQLLMRQGTKVIGFARYPRTPYHFDMDVTMQEQNIARLIENASPEGYDVWINLAGADIMSGENRRKPYLERLQQLWDIDVLGTIKCSRAVIPHLNHNGIIINVAWDEALSGASGDSASLYGTAKAAIIGYSASLSKSLAPGILVYVVSPGWVVTRWAQTLTPEQRMRLIRQSAGQRWIEPWEIAASFWNIITYPPPSGTVVQVK